MLVTLTKATKILYIPFLCGVYLKLMTFFPEQTWNNLSEIVFLWFSCFFFPKTEPQHFACGCSVGIISCFSVLQPFSRNQQEVDGWWDVPGWLWRPVPVSKITFCSHTSCLLQVERATLFFYSSINRDGTTDITRTVHWGTPTPMQKVHRWKFVTYAVKKYLHPVFKKHVFLVFCFTGGLYSSSHGKHWDFSNCFSFRDKRWVEIPKTQIK